MLCFRLVSLDQQGLPDRVTLGQPSGRGNLVIQKSRFGGGSAPRTKREQADGPAEGAVWDCQAVANPNYVIGLSYRDLIDRNRA